MFRKSKKSEQMVQEPGRVGGKHLNTLLKWSLAAITGTAIASSLPVIAEAGESSSVVFTANAQPLTDSNTSEAADSSTYVGNTSMQNHSDTTVTARKYPTPPPFTEQEFWIKVVGLVSENHGYITHDKFEKTFGVEMKKGAHLEGVQGFGLSAGTDWYFDASVRETDADYKGLPPGIAGGATSSLAIKFPLDAFEKHTCVIAGNVAKLLLDAGWVLKEKKVWMMTQDQMGDLFVMGNGEIYLKHYVHYLNPNKKDDDATCVTEFSVNGKP